MKKMIYKDYTQNNLDISRLQLYLNDKNHDRGENFNVVRNYKVMCELLNEEVLAGDSKKAQVNRWKRYFEFHKDGQKFVIDEVYDEPFATDDARKRREGLYVKYIELLLLEFLSRQKDYKVTVGNKEMYHILGMTNELYDMRSRVGTKKGNEIIRQTIMNNEDKFVFSNSPLISNFDVNNFYFRAEQKLNKILYSALRSMQSRFLIDYKKVNIIAEPVSEGSNKLEFRESSAYEDKLILEAKNRIIKQMGFNNTMEIMLCYKCDEFYERFNNYVKEEYGWDRCYPQLRVVYIDNIAKQIPLKAEEIRKLSTEDKKTQLNAEIIKCLNVQAEKRYEDTEAKFFEIEADRIGTEKGNSEECAVEKPFVYKSNYVEIQRALADYLLNIHSKPLEMNPKKTNEENKANNKQDEGVQDDEMEEFLNHLTD